MWEIVDKSIQINLQSTTIVSSQRVGITNAEAMIDLALNGSTSYLCKVDFLLQRLQTRTRFFITIPIAGITRIVKDHCRSFFYLYTSCVAWTYTSHIELMERLNLSIDLYVTKPQLTWAGHVARMEFDRLSRKFLSSSSWVNITINNLLVTLSLRMIVVWSKDKGANSNRLLARVCSRDGFKVRRTPM